VTLNDPAFVEAAVMLGRRMWEADPQGTDRGRWIDTGFRLCTGRFPEPAERERLLTFVEAQQQRFAADPSAARKLLGTEGLRTDEQKSDSTDRGVNQAACAMVANVLLSLDETITRP
jgi:hypothetical protein